MIPKQDFLQKRTAALKIQRKAWRKTVAAFLVTMLTFWLIFSIMTSSGIFPTLDSEAYLLAAHSLWSTGSFGVHYQHWPPLFPMLLAIWGSSQWGIFWLNGLSLAGAVGLWIRLAKLATGSDLVVLWLGLALACQVSFVQSGLFIWSEPFFHLLLVVYVSIWHQMMVKPKIQWGILLIVLALLLVMQRYLGLLWVLGSGVGLWWLGADRGVRIWSWAQAGVSLVAIGLWRAELVSTSVGVDFSHLVQHAPLSLQNISKVLIPNFLNGIVGLVSALLLLVFWLVWQMLTLPSRLRIGLMLSMGAYLAGLWLLLWLTPNGQMIDNDRYLSVIYPPLLFLSAVAAHHTLRLFPKHRRFKWLYGLWLLYPAARIVYHLLRWHGDKIGIHL